MGSLVFRRLCSLHVYIVVVFELLCLVSSLWHSYEVVDDCVFVLCEVFFYEFCSFFVVGCDLF